MNLTSPEVTAQLQAVTATGSPNVVAVIDSLQSEYQAASADLVKVRGAFNAAQETYNAATLRRRQAAQALAAYGVTVDQ